jgi:hypothetical protein
VSVRGSAPWLVALAVIALTLGAPSAARAQQWLMGGEASVATGAEGGGDPRGVFRRARTTMRLGGDLRVDERPSEFYAAGVLMELEPRTTFGVDLRYGRLISPRWSVDAGVIGFLTPETLLGVSVGAMGRDNPGKGLAFMVGPRVDVMFAGSDLPTSRPIWQLLICGGIHVDL